MAVAISSTSPLTSVIDQFPSAGSGVDLAYDQELCNLNLILNIAGQDESSSIQLFTNTSTDYKPRTIRALYLVYAHGVSGLQKDRRAN